MDVAPFRSPLAGLQYQEALSELLGAVIDLRDRQLGSGRVASLKPIVLNPNSPRGNAARRVVSLLADPNTSESEFWGELCWLSREYECFKIQTDKKRALTDPEWIGAKLYFNGSTEETVRVWLGRPAINPQDEEWRKAIILHQNAFEIVEVVMAWKRPELPAGYSSYGHYLSCWAEVGATLKSTNQMSWRQLSAQCFMGDSKFLETESQQTLARRLFPTLTRKIVARPLLLHVYLPPVIERVLIVENQDTFTGLADASLQSTALVYGMGYRAGSARVRQVGVPHFSLYGCSVEPVVLSQFERWWVEQEAQDWGVYFWGDLDYAGLDIASGLRKSFPSLDCWPEGYEPMLKLLDAGGGHTPEQAGKARQRQVFETGCSYADKFLLPVLEACGRFVDQEVILAEKLPGLDSM